MTVVADRITGPSAILHEVAEAEAYVASVCFKTGPPELIGVELEWTVHRAEAVDQPVPPDLLRAALGPHAPPPLDPAGPHSPLPHGGLVTIEPGGQIEISSPPHRSLVELHRRTESDIAYLTGLLAGSGLILGRHGIDPYRGPRPFLETPRYAAMAAAFDRRGPQGQDMMRCTAGLQVCLDAGPAADLPARWQALHLVGPPLVAVFANARRKAGRDSGWVSARMGAWLGIDPARTAAVWPAPGPDPDLDPALAWARYAIAAPLLCLRRPGGSWAAPPGVSFADWINGALPGRPTTEDLDYHLGTLFPPVRARGYLEVRYLDALPPGEWIAPTAVLVALLAAGETVTEVRRICAPMADAWRAAAREGLAHPAVARAARQLLDLARSCLGAAELDSATQGRVLEIIGRRLAAGGELT